MLGYKEVKMVEQFYKTFNQEDKLNVKRLSIERINLRDKLFREEEDEYYQAKETNDRVEMLDAIVDMYYIHIGTLLELGETYATIVDKLYVENIPKFKPNRRRTHDIWEKVIENNFQNIINKAFKEVHESNMSKLGEDGKPILREDGKILKGKNYFKPNLSQFIK